MRIMANVKNVLTILTIVILGFLIRLIGINWDQGTFLHPDERFLVMVTQELEIPSSIKNYFSPESTLRVENTSHKFYVYGTFPVVLIKVISNLALDKENFTTLTSLGRTISLFLETGTILLVFFLAKSFTKKYNLPKMTPFWSSLLYSLMVLPIQLSHFFTVDPFVTFFGLLAVVLFTLTEEKESISKTNSLKSNLWFILGGVSWGIAISSKIAAIFFAPLLLSLFLFYNFEKYSKNTKIKEIIIKSFFSGIIFLVTTYATVRIINPEYFAFSSWFNLDLSNLFLKNIRTLQSWSTPQSWFPPATQWQDRTPILFSLKNIFFFGLGIWQSIIIFGGMSWSFLKKTKTILSFILLWIIGFIVWQGSQFTQTLRYFYFLYPFLALFGGIGLSVLQQKIPKKRQFFSNIFLLIIIMIWPLMFLQIFMVNHTRVQATHWIRKNIPKNSNLVYEYWDDALPLSYVPGKNVHYKTEALPVFEKESTKKWEEINRKINNTDYYILSSNRAWASISRLPDRYPQTAEFYQDLFNEKNNFYLQKTFQSYPSLKWLGIPITFNDQWAEEAFTVYDHPTVYIFEKK
jgi:hypothetical protein